MYVYICPICMANLHRSGIPGMGRCDDCSLEYPLDRRWSMERMVPADERVKCVEVRP